MREGALYGEWFEVQDTTTVPSVGTSVVCIPNTGKIREATMEDDPSSIIGVVRPRFSPSSTTILNAAENEWHEKYLKDMFGQFVTEPHDLIEWIENVQLQPAIPAKINEETGQVEREAQPEIVQKVLRKYHSHLVPADVVIPPEATTIPNVGRHRVVNPDYDATQPYVPRSQRPEWVLVGLLGRVSVLKTSLKNPSWQYISSISDHVESWLLK
jgi:hypothetical protein